MKELESITDIKKLIKALPEAKFLEDYSRLVEEYEKSLGDTPFNVDTIGLAARMVQLFFHPKTWKALGIKYPEKLRQLHPTICEIKEQVNVGEGAYVDLIARVGKTRFSFDLCYQPGHGRPNGYILLATTKLIDAKSSGLSRSEISELVNIRLREFQEVIREDKFVLFIEESTGDVLFRGGRAYEQYIPLYVAMEMAIKLIAFMASAPEIQKVFSKAHPDSLYFFIDE